MPAPKVKLVLSVAIGFIGLMRLSVFIQSLPIAIFFSIYFIAILLAFIVSTRFIIKTPFLSASLVVSGIFVGIVTDIILFPTFNGFERNLFPLEIFLHTLAGALICYISAAIWYFIHAKNKQNT